MAPALRSSAPSTPKPRKSSATTTPSTTPQRKVHTCTKCGRPKAGHPRSGCPYIDSPAPNDEQPTQSTETPNAIATAMTSMNIASPVVDSGGETKAAIRARRASVHWVQVPDSGSVTSLPADSQGIVNQMLQHGMFGGGNGYDTDMNEEADDQEKLSVVEWRDTPDPAPLERKPRVKMPGSLSTPSPEPSFVSYEGSSKGHSLSQHGDASLASFMSSAGAATTGPFVKHAQSLTRSMSMEERDLFISNLSSASHATVYAVPVSDIYDIQAAAIKLGFHARIILGKDDRDAQGLLVLGRDEKAVQSLFDKVRSAGEKKQASRFGAVAKGAVVGAVGTWAGLAFIN